MATTSTTTKATTATKTPAARKPRAPKPSTTKAKPAPVEDKGCSRGRLESWATKLQYSVTKPAKVDGGVAVTLTYGEGGEVGTFTGSTARAAYGLALAAIKATLAEEAATLAKIDAEAAVE